MSDLPNCDADDFYAGKVRCPECCEGRRPVYDEKYGEHEEQCWFCGASGWVTPDEGE